MSEQEKFIIMVSFVNWVINRAVQIQNKEQKNLLRRQLQPEFFFKF